MNEPDTSRTSGETTGTGDDAPHSTLDAFLGATPRRGQRQLISLVVLVLALIAIAALFVRFVAGSDSPYYVATIENGDFEPRLSEAGTVHGEDELTIRARLDGRLAALEVTSGSRVAYGTVLAKIESRGSEESLAAQKASLAAAQADLEAAQVTRQEVTARLARFEKVWRESDHRVPSANEMARARAEAQRASEGVTSAKARLKTERLRLEAEQEQARGRVIRAPFDAIVLVRDVEPGQVIYKDMPLFTLVRADSPLTLQVPLASRTAMALKPGTRANVRFEAKPDLEQQAVLERIDTVDGTRIAHFTLPSPGPDVRPGMAARLEVALAERNDVLLVPDAALEFSPENVELAADERNSVYLLGEDGNPRRVYVTTGGSDGGRTEVFSAQLHAGQDVIIGWREAPSPRN